MNTLFFRSCSITISELGNSVLPVGSQGQMYCYNFFACVRMCMILARWWTCITPALLHLWLSFNTNNMCMCTIDNCRKDKWFISPMTHPNMHCMKKLSQLLYYCDALCKLFIKPYHQFQIHLYPSKIYETDHFFSFWKVP